MEWTRDYARSVRQEWATYGKVPSRRALARRLSNATKDRRLAVRYVEFLDVGQRWARVVLVSNVRGRAATKQIPRILAELNPQTQVTGTFAYSGFFLAVRDFRDAPLVVAWQEQQGRAVTGATWARSRDLDPFAHF